MGIDFPSCVQYREKGLLKFEMVHFSSPDVRLRPAMLYKAAELIYFWAMQVTSTDKKLFKIALITSPFFGLFGSTPGFAFREFEPERMLRFFLFITCFTFYLWLINIAMVAAIGKIERKRKSLLWYIASVVTCLLSVYLISLLLPVNTPPSRMHLPEMPGGTMRNFAPHNMLFMPMVQALSINIIVVILTELIILKETKTKVDSENEQLKLANLEAKNNQLQQQLHPHFLFNSLSTLRSLIGRSPEKAGNYLEKLSDLLRFSTNNSHQSLISLKEEIELCTNYLIMQQTRFGDALQFTINIPEAMHQSGKVPIFSLQQLAENAIKHNVLTIEQPLFITIEQAVNEGWIIIKNNLQPKQSIEIGGGVGLANLSERYKLTGHEDIKITINAEVFCVEIKILAHAGNNN